jgi:hypothetical protein
VHGHFWGSLAGPFFVAGAGGAFSFIPISIGGLTGVASGRPDSPPACSTPRSSSAAQSGRDRLHGRRHPYEDAARRRRRDERCADGRLPVGLLGSAERLPSSRRHHRAHSAPQAGERDRGRAVPALEVGGVN